MTPEKCWLLFSIVYVIGKLVSLYYLFWDHDLASLMWCETASSWAMLYAMRWKIRTITRDLKAENDFHDGVAA